ncbi:GHMP family kinase ATP-binding protein [Paludibaculum fermentans]|uniref:GHMP family kinase ATP-binding protein n=1 Tax=Paludibaculum fermentans TaxID=1473598 RepID=UPI003EB830CA
MQVFAKSPCRVDLAGGTLDIWPLYLYHPNAVTLNFAVSVYTSCRIMPHEGNAITLRSQDQDMEETFDSLSTLMAAPKVRNVLAAMVVKHFKPAGGMVVETNSESPQGAGISGSSALLISTVSAFNKFCNTRHNIERVREIAQNIEAQVVNVPTGCQDYYPAMYGGVSAIDLTVAGIQRNNMPVDLAELNSRFVLAYTGKPRNSGINNWEVMKLHIDGDKKVLKNFARIAEIAHGMRGALASRDWNETARLLREEWSHRKKNAPGISTPLIDHLIASTKKSGARAAKVCGAGGGGCVVFLCEPDARERVAQAIETEGAGQGVKVLPVEVAPKGVVVKTLS